MVSERLDDVDFGWNEVIALLVQGDVRRFMLEKLDTEMLGQEIDDLGGFAVEFNVFKFNSFKIEFILISLNNPHRHPLCGLQFLVEPPFLSVNVASSLCPSFLFLQSLDL